MKILKECYKKALDYLSGNRESLDKLAEYLIKHETITGKEFMKIYRKVNNIDEPAGDNYDALVLDIDGTLVTSEKIVSEKTRETIISAQQRGKIIAIASGRSIAGVRKVASAIKLEEFGGYVIAYNGTTVINCKTGECIFNNVIPKEMFAEIIAVSKEVGVGISVYNDAAKEELYANGLNRYIEADAKACSVTLREAEDLEKELTFPVNKFLLAGEPEKMESLEKKLRNKFSDRLNVFRSDPFFVEILPKYIDKGVAIQRLAAHLDLRREKIICAGDSYNDLPMLRCAGLGVAMGNAQEEVKKVADYVTDSNDEDGIVKVIERFMTESKEDKENQTDGSDD